jgi:hypothetical protein
MKKIKAQGHVEIFLSFILFASFLLFLFVYINPFAKQKEPDYIIKNIERSIINNISLETGKLSVFPNESDGCYNLSTEIISAYGSNYREVKENSRKYSVYFSDALAPSSPNKDSRCDGKNYSLGAYLKENFAIYEKIEQLNRSYILDYEGTRKSLGITKEFSFLLRNKAGINIFETKRYIPEGIEVTSREVPILVINSQAQVSELILYIKTW